MRIRETVIEDVPAIDRIKQANEPWQVTTLETQRLWFASNPPEAQVARAVAVGDNGEVLGFGWVKRDLYTDRADTAVGTVQVHPDHWGKGIGTALKEWHEAYLRSIGITRLVAYWGGSEASARFAAKHGYSLGAVDKWIVVDPRALPAVPELAAGVTVITAAEAGPQAWYDVSDTAAQDEPGDSSYTGMPYEEWLKSHWPGFDHEVSLMAVVDGKPAATTGLNINMTSGKALSAGTDCLREFRGRGLVKLIKVLSLRAAAERGVTAAYTGNDETNAPMRAINKWLGYELVGESRTAIKDFAP